MPDFNRYFLTACCCLSLQLLSIQGSSAGTYIWTDDEGVVHFTDTPPPTTGRSKTKVEKREQDVSSKWIDQKPGERIYEDDMIRGSI